MTPIHYATKGVPDGVAWCKEPTREIIGRFEGSLLFVPLAVDRWEALRADKLRFVDDPRLAFAKYFEGWSHGREMYSASSMTQGRIHRTAVIGRPGFGFARDPEDGKLYRLPHVGRVLLGKDVEVGAHACIDRGCLTDTVIGDGTKIDNLVHVAHGVTIGEHCWIAAGAVLCGSSSLGDRVEVGVNASILPGVKVGDRAVIGAGAVVTKDVEAGMTAFGNPARAYRLCGGR